MIFTSKYQRPSFCTRLLFSIENTMSKRKRWEKSQLRSIWESTWILLRWWRNFSEGWKEREWEGVRHNDIWLCPSQPLTARWAWLVKHSFIVKVKVLAFSTATLHQVPQSFPYQTLNCECEGGGGGGNLIRVCMCVCVHKIWQVPLQGQGSLSCILYKCLCIYCISVQLTVWQ